MGFQAHQPRSPPPFSSLFLPLPFSLTHTNLFVLLHLVDSFAQSEAKFNHQWATGVWDYQDQVPLSDPLYITHYPHYLHYHI